MDDKDDLPAKTASEWNGRRVSFTILGLTSLVICITCAIVSQNGDQTLPAVLAFALMIICWYELQQKNQDTGRDLGLIG